jgi:hypothetical protein
MAVSYNHIAGQSVERPAAPSDGVFAVAMTLLVLDLRVPAMEAMHSERAPWRALIALSPAPCHVHDEFHAAGHFSGSVSRRNSITSPAPTVVFRGSISCSCSRFRSHLSPPLFWPNFPSTAPHFSSTGEYSAFGKHVALQLAVCVGNGTSQT